MLRFALILAWGRPFQTANLFFRLSPTLSQERSRCRLLNAFKNAGLVLPIRIVLLESVSFKTIAGAAKFARVKSGSRATGTSSATLTGISTALIVTSTMKKDDAPSCQVAPVTPLIERTPTANLFIWAVK